MINKKYTIFVLTLFVLLIISGCAKRDDQKPDQTNNVQNNQEEQKKEESKTSEQNQVDSRENNEIKPLALDDIQSWKIFRNEELGIEFNYPSQFGEITLNYSETGLYGRFDNSFYIKSRANYKGGTEDRVSNVLNFEKRNNEYYINYISGSIKVVPKKIINNNIIFVDCLSYDTKCNLPGGPSIILPKGLLLGVANLEKDSFDFKAISFFVQDKEVSEEVFIKILESVKLF